MGLVVLTIAVTLVPGRLAAQDPAGNLSDRIDALVTNLYAPDSPGCVVGAVRNHEVLYARGHGLASLENGNPLTPDTPIYAASLAKQFIAAGVLLAERGGYLSLDDDIRTYLPEMPEYDAPITIRHLIHHTSGVRDMYVLKWLPKLEEVDQPGEQEALSLLMGQEELNFNPGTAVAYTTSNYELLAHILTRATGRPHWEFLQVELFEPLGMSHTALHHGNGLGATGYRKTSADGFEPVEVDQRRGVYTSVRDLLLWDENLYESRIGGDDFSRQLTRPELLSNGELGYYAFGLIVGEYKGLRTVAHGGSWKGFRSAYLRFPDQEFSAMCLCNTERVFPQLLVSQVAGVVLADDLSDQEEEALDLSESDLRTFVGTYANYEGLGPLVEVRDGALTFVGETRLNPLVPISPTRFRSPSFGNNEYQFYRDQEEGSWWFQIFPNLPGLQPSRQFVFHQVQLVSPTRAALEELEGVYESSEAHATFRIDLEQEALVLVRSGDLPVLELQPIVVDTFVQDDKNLTLRFVRDDRGEVTGFGLETAGVLNLRFDRRSQ